MLQRSLRRAASGGGEGGGGGGAAAQSTCIQRVLRELTKYAAKPHAAVHVFPVEDNVSIWRLLFQACVRAATAPRDSRRDSVPGGQWNTQGPSGTPYAGGVFEAVAVFPNAYPALPPEIRFVTPVRVKCSTCKGSAYLLLQIIHCNINRSGKICHSIFDRAYAVDTTMFTILACVYGLLLAPEPLDPLDSELGELYLTDRCVRALLSCAWRAEARLDGLRRRAASGTTQWPPGAWSLEALPMLAQRLVLTRLQWWTRPPCPANSRACAYRARFAGARAPHAGRPQLPHFARSIR